jgi:DNA-binding transcriptional LysR family regulator
MFAGFELRRFPYALAVAEELNFARAALRLHVAQPSVSNQIRELEEEISVQLFERDNMHVKLTPAGRRFIREAKLAVLHSERAVEQAKHSSPDGESLVIGYSPRMNLQILSIARTVSTSPSAKFKMTLVSSHTNEQLQSLVEGTMHIGLVTLPLKNDIIATKLLIREPLCVVLPESHRLAAKTDLKARELNGLPVISFPRHLSPLFHDHLHTLFKKEGYVPNVIQEVTTHAEALYMVAQGMGITILKRSGILPGHPRIVCRRFREATLVEETGVAHRRNSRSNEIQAFVAALRKSVAQIADRALNIDEPQAGDDPRQLKLF